MVVVDILKSRYNRGKEGRISFFRKLLPDSPAGCLIYDGDLEFKGEEAQVINFRKIGKELFSET